MQDQLYSKAILRWAARLEDETRLKKPCWSVTRTSRLCGSRLVLDLDVDKAGIIHAVGHQVKACAIGQAACAVFLSRLKGRSFADICDVGERFRTFLAEGATPDWPEDWQELEIFAPVKTVRARHGAALLMADALQSLRQDRQGVA